MDEEPGIGSGDARRRVRDSGYPLDEWEAWPPSRSIQAQVDRDDRHARWFVWVLITLLVVAVAAFTVFGWGATGGGGDVCQDDRGAYVC